MRNKGAKLSRRQRRWFYTVFIGLFLSGLAGGIMEYFFRNDSNMMTSTRTVSAWAMKIHGAFAMIFLIVLGSLIPTHVKKAWRANLNRGNGLFMLFLNLFLVLTGYGLYYFANENLRSRISISHWVVGLALPFLLYIHIYLGRKRSEKRLPS